MNAAENTAREVNVMSNSEILDANAARAKAEADAWAQESAARMAFEARQEAEEKKRRQLCRSADNRMFLRACALIAMFIIVTECVKSGLLADVLAGFVIITGISWFAFQLGAWWQFRIVMGAEEE